MTIPADYAERVYAGVLGKIIGVYLGRPVEGWSHRNIVAQLGEIRSYVNEQRGMPIVLTDDDISGTFTFLRALEDYGRTRAISAAQIGQTWLNYLIEERTVLWWGGMGNSTEHTAYIRLKRGIPAPRSGSIALNGKVVAEQIGAQIFIDGWAMVAPGDPDLAAELAGKAASVSHDGEAKYGAQVVAVMESLAFVEPDLATLLDAGLARIPANSVIARMIGDLRRWRAEEPDWRKARERLEASYGYDKYGGNCHMVPNHGVIILALLYGGGAFGESLMIANTCGWDTDCNSGNVGCLLGIRNGLAGLADGADWRGPVADRMYLPTADGGRGVTDALTEAGRIVALGRTLAGEPPAAPKDGARFHFSLPGAVQGFRPDESADTASVGQVPGPAGAGTLAIRFRGLGPGAVARAATDTFIPPETLAMPGYGLVASPTLYPGQVVRAVVAADARNAGSVRVRPYVRAYGERDTLVFFHGPDAALGPGDEGEVAWRVPDTAGGPVAKVGLEIASDRTAAGVVTIDRMTWGGAPDVTLRQPEFAGTAWGRAWVNGADAYHPGWGGGCMIAQHDGRGLVIQGTREWTDYRVTATVTPHLIKTGGRGARVQGMRRYYALLLDRAGTIRLVKALDGERVLAEKPFPVEFDAPVDLALEVC
ncbi:MAG: ADP-ribosylglycohydrolase family protein, partial [bacterium]